MQKGRGYRVVEGLLTLAKLVIEAVIEEVQFQWDVALVHSTHQHPVTMTTIRGGFGVWVTLSHSAHIHMHTHTHIHTHTYIYTHTLGVSHLPCEHQYTCTHTYIHNYFGCVM